jgi:hypothetical protein
MNVYVDCEFDGFGGPLMSIALVTEDGREWYEVLTAEASNPWVALNVVPVLGKEPIGVVAARMSMHRFLRGIDGAHVIADWYTDLVHFFAMFAGRDHSESVLIPCTAELRSVEYRSEVPHNALADARAIRDALSGAMA